MRLDCEYQSDVPDAEALARAMGGTPEVAWITDDDGCGTSVMFGLLSVRKLTKTLIDCNGYPIRVGIPATAGTTKPSPLTNKWTPWGMGK